MHKLFTLENKAIVITGSCRGIGKGMAKRFAEFGAKLIISSRKIDACKEVEEEINKNGGMAFSKECNISEKTQCDELIEFWENVPWSLKYNQNLYLDYLRKMNFSCVFSNITLPPQYSYFPPWSFVLRVIFKIFSHFSNRDISHFYNKYLKYHMAYGHSYPQESYFDYLKDSQFHRNPISYGSQEYIKELDSKILSENNQNFF